jgi:hypothetical protein
MRMRSASSSRSGCCSPPLPAGGLGGASRFSGRAINTGSPAGAASSSGGISCEAGWIIPPVCSPAISLANIDVFPAFSAGPDAGSFCLAARSAATSIMTSRNATMTPPKRYMGTLFTRRTPDFFDTSPGEASGAI